MATTIAIFVLKPKSNECIYHVERMLLICNNNLFNTAIDCKLPEYIRSLAFDRRTWYPDLTLRKGKALKTTTRQSLADKSIADVCEALIGAAYLSSKDDNLNMAVKAVTQMSKSKYHNMRTFNDYYASFKVPDWQQANSNANQRRLVQKVADATGYHFKSAPLLQSAFTHPSYTYSGNVPHYQRLEFLGDALLDMTIVEYLYRNFPLADPQWLTEHKMAMASNQFLGCLCVKLNLHHHLLFNTSQFLSKIRDYVTELEMAEETAREEAEEEGTPMRMDFWLNATPPPKAYADSIEALVGAMFVDSEFDYSIVESFFNKFIFPYFADMSLYDTFANKHPVTFLERRMTQEIGCADWRMASDTVIPDIDRGVAVLKENEVISAFLVHQKIITSHRSHSGRNGKVEAAKQALKLLDSYEGDVVAIKKAWGCDCDTKTGDMEVDHGTAI
jgi:endoribonuclease Dicer